jgi:hypothetical protein
MSRKMLLVFLQILLLIIWRVALPALPWWIAFLPGLVLAARLLFQAASLAGVIVHDYRNKTHTPFFK